MKKIILILLLFIGHISYAKEYYVTYTTTEDQITINHATIKVVPSDGDTLKLIVFNNQSVLVEFTGLLHKNFIDVIGNETVESGYLYEHLNKLRGSLFVNFPDTKNLILIIREK